MSKINIAIDGYSSCGKGTLAKSLAQLLNYRFIDSGSMYRAVTLFFMENRVPLNDADAVNQALQSIVLDFVFNTENQRFEIHLNGANVEKQIRSMEVASSVSEVAAIPEVRSALVRMQQALGSQKGIVMDGRDIGTVVFPDAELKIFMTAKPEIRAQRRYTELKLSGAEVTLDEVFQNLNKRDEIDSNRKDSPLTFHSGYRLLDNSHISPKEQLEIAQIWVMEILNSESKY
jgi:cytidylate kinase